MKEKIILASGCNGTEILRTLARFGKNTIGYRVINSIELAQIALMRSGISIAEELLTKQEETAVIYSFLSGIPYFKSASFADAESLAEAVRTMRGLVKNNEAESIKTSLSKGVFFAKNEALFAVYSKYVDYCKVNHKIDGIGVIRKALDLADTFEADFTVLKEFPLMPIEEALIEKLSNNHFESISLTDLLSDGQTKERPPYVYTEAYGIVNEIEDIIDYIFRNRIPLDQCVIACAGGSEYIQNFYDLSGEYNLSVAFAQGVPIINSYPAIFLKCLSNWDTLGYHGIDALRELLLCEAFDRGKLKEAMELPSLSGYEIEAICKMAGALRISCNPAINRIRIDAYRDSLTHKKAEAAASGKAKELKSAEDDLAVLEKVEKLAAEFAIGIIEFFEKYAVIRSEPMRGIDLSAREVISDRLRVYDAYVIDGDVNNIVPQLLEQMVHSESSKEGRLHITSLAGAMSSMRENLFICGLSAAEFPGSPVENYLLLDNDLLSFDAGKAFTSENRIEQNKAAWEQLLNLADSLGIPVRLSYSGFSLSELKDRNPSSVLFTCFEKENGKAGMEDFRKAVRKVGYFDSALSSTRLIGEGYLKRKSIAAEPLYPDRKEYVKDKTAPLERAWSPSAIDIFFQCPRRFYLAKILELPEKETDNPHDVWTAKDEGKLAHSMMEKLAYTTMSKSDFLSYCAEACDDFFLSRPPMHEDSAGYRRKEFLEMMETAYELEMSNSKEVLAVEEEYSFDHPSGIKLHGYPDRVEKDAEGKYLIVDYKTKRKIEHAEDDIDSCLQVIIYAWLCKQKGIDISRCEYRYLRKGKTIPCVYNADMENKLEEKLGKFRDALINDEYPLSENQATSCKYCKFGDICKLWD